MAPRLVYEFGAFHIDTAERVLARDGRPVSLTPKAVETLLALLERHGHLVTKEDLLRTVWPDAFVEENNLAQNISVLRRVLGERPDGESFIETIPKRGYRFVGEVLVRREGQPEPAAPAPALHPTGTPASHDVARPSADSHGRRPFASAMVGALFAVVTTALVVTVGRFARAPDPAVSPTSTGPLASVEKTGREALTRVAVLPFINLGPVSDAAFVAGMTEEIASRLAGLDHLAVPSGTTIAEYDRRGKGVSRIGADLGVEYLIEGSVRWAAAPGATHVRITPKLIRVADDTTVWTEQYEAPIADIFAVQASIAYQITGALQVALNSRERSMIEARPTADVEAYLAYLRGLASYQQGASDTANLAQARKELESAVMSDSRFALAWTWLARVYASQYRTGGHRTPDTYQSAQRAARTAIDLAPGLPEAHLGLAQVLAAGRDYEPARREWDIARIGLPNSAELWQTLAFLEQRQGRWVESLAAYTRAFDLDPASTADLIATHYLHLRQFPEARRFIDVARAANRAGALVPDAWTRFSASGDVAKARPLLETALAARSPADARARALLARLEWFDGRHDRALELIEAMDGAGAWMAPNFRFPASLAAGQVYESMGRTTEAAHHYGAAMAELEQKQAEFPDNYQTEAALALAAAGLGRAVEAVRHAKRAVELSPIAIDAAEGPLYLYLLAQVHSRLGDQDSAFAVLDRMYAVPGFYNEVWVKRDPGFAGLRSHPSFHVHVDRWSRQHGDLLLRQAAPPLAD